MTAIGLMYEEEKQEYGNYCQAQFCVDLVNNKVKATGVSAQEACEQIGIPYSQYMMATSIVRTYSEKELQPA